MRLCAILEGQLTNMAAETSAATSDAAPEAQEAKVADQGESENEDSALRKGRKRGCR